MSSVTTREARWVTRRVWRGRCPWQSRNKLGVARTAARRRSAERANVAGSSAFFFPPLSRSPSSHDAHREQRSWYQPFRKHMQAARSSLSSLLCRHRPFQQFRTIAQHPREHKPIGMEKSKAGEASRPARGSAKNKPQRGRGGASSGKLRGLPTDSPQVRTSKTVSWILRHGADKEGVTLRPDGYARVQDLVSKLCATKTCRVLKHRASSSADRS